MLLVVIDVCAYPTYMGCGGTRDGNIVTCDSIIMGQKLQSYDNGTTITILDTDTSRHVRQYEPGREYTVKVNIVGNKRSYDSVSSGMIKGQTLRTCTDAMVDAGEYRWIAPDTPTLVNITHIDADGYGRAKILIVSVGTDDSQYISNACNQSASTYTEPTCRTNNKVGSKKAERWMYFSLQLVWIIFLRIAAPLRPSLNKSATRLLLDIAALVTFIYFAAGDGFAYGIIWAVLCVHLVLSVYLIYGTDWITVCSAIPYFLLGTLQFLTILTSLHHWCWGEQSWNTMSGDWGAFDSFQGTIPWWSVSNVWVLWYLTIQRAKYDSEQPRLLQSWWHNTYAKLFEQWHYAFKGGKLTLLNWDIWTFYFASVCFVLLLAGIFRDKGIPIFMIVVSTLAIGFIFDAIGWRILSSYMYNDVQIQFGEKCMVVLMLVIIADWLVALVPNDDGVTYSDVCSWIQVVTSTVVGVIGLRTMLHKS